MLNKHILQVTIFLLFFNYLYLSMKKNKNAFEKYITYILGIDFILGVYFWNDPIKGSIQHILDANAVKVSGVIFLIYYMFYKNDFNKLDNCIFIVLSTISIILSCLSHYYSTILNQWGSFNHYLYHVLLHIFANLTIFYLIK